MVQVLDDSIVAVGTQTATLCDDVMDVCMYVCIPECLLPVG